MITAHLTPTFGAIFWLCSAGSKMSNAITHPINAMNIRVGDIIQDHGAQFEVVQVTRHGDYDSGYQANIGKWLSGEVAPGYFGPGKDWNMQGNKSAIYYKVQK
jgi:hypothetical protein